MRATRHNARYCKRDGHVFSPKHNDRNYDYENAPNINADKTPMNIYFNVYDGIYRHKNRQGKMTFEEAENKFYEEHFKAQYLKQQQAYEAKGQQCYMKSFEEWKSAKRYVPEETYMQIGKVGETIDEKLFTDTVADYIAGMQSWSKQNGEPFTILDWSIQYDEAIPQIHIRQVWHYTDKDGNLCIGQAKALEQAKIPLPDPTEKQSSKNNRKQTYDKYMRQQWLDACERHGLAIEREPLMDVEHDRTKEEILDEKLEEAQNAIAEAEQAKQEAEQAKQEAEQAKQEAEQAKQEAEQAKQQYETALSNVQNIQKDAITLVMDCKRLNGYLKHDVDTQQASKLYEKQIESRNSRLEALNESLLGLPSQNSKDCQNSL